MEPAQTVSTLIRVAKWSVLLQKVKRCPSNVQPAIARVDPHGVFVMGMQGDTADCPWSLTSTGVIVFIPVGPRRPEGEKCGVASREPRPGREKICRVCVARASSWRPRMSTVRGVYAGWARGHLFEVSALSLSGVNGMALGNRHTPREASKALGDVRRRLKVRAAARTSPMSQLLGHWPCAAPAPRKDVAVGS